MVFSLATSEGAELIIETNLARWGVLVAQKIIVDLSKRFDIGVSTCSIMIVLIKPNYSPKLIQVRSFILMSCLTLADSIPKHSMIEEFLNFQMKLAEAYEKITHSASKLQCENNLITNNAFLKHFPKELFFF